MQVAHTCFQYVINVINTNAVSMLSFDIECEGLNKFEHRITVASVYDPDNNIEENFNFLRGDVQDHVFRFLKRLDDAETLCSFNGARFDIPFIIENFRVPLQRYNQWYMKLFDYFEICKNLFASSCSLNKLLESNGEEVKTSSGLIAVQWAKEKEFDKLEAYCMMVRTQYHIQRVESPINF